MGEASKKPEPGWKWYRLSVVDEDGRGFDPANATKEIKIPFYAHAIAGHTFAYQTEHVTRGTDGQTLRIPVAGAADRLWVSGDEDDELVKVKARMNNYVVRWKANGGCADVFERGTKVYRPERGDVPLARYLRMEEIPEPAVTALV